MIDPKILINIPRSHNCDIFPDTRGDRRVDLAYHDRYGASTSLQIKVESTELPHETGSSLRGTLTSDR